MASTTHPTPSTASDTYLRGWQRLKEVDDQAGEKVIAALQDVAPDLGRHIVEFGFGQIYTRPGLTLRQRELATVAMLAALGNAAPQLKVHVEAALNVGLSREEIVETLIQTAVYAGFPAALNAVFAAQEVFARYQAPHRPLAPMAVAQAFAAALAQGSLRRDLLAEDIEWIVPGDPARTPWTGTRHGREAVDRFWQQVAEAGEPLAFDVLRWYDGEDEVLARGRFAYRYRNGHVYDGPFVLRLCVRDGLLTRYEMFEDSGAIAQAHGQTDVRKPAAMR